MTRTTHSTIAILSAAALAAATLAPRAARADEPSTDATPAAEEASPAAGTSATPRATTPAAAAAESADVPRVRVHVDSPAVVAIERADTGELVCTSPCDADLPADVAYRVGGSRPSRAFLLDASRSADLHLAVTPATKRGSVIGWSLLGGGALVLGSGVATLLLANANREALPGPADEGVTETGFTDGMYVGAALAIAGAALSIAGGSYVLGNRETRVRGNVTPTAPAKGSRSAPAVGREGAPGPVAAPAPLFSVPILGGTF